MKKILEFIIFVFFLKLKVYSFEPVLTFFSNSPEYVKNDGFLISGTISQFTPTIIYFYHLNDTDKDKNIYLKFIGNCEYYINFFFSESSDNYFKVGNDVGAHIFKNFNPERRFLDGQYLFEIPFKASFLVSGYIWVFSNGRIDFESWVGEPNYRYILPLDKKHVKGIFGMGRIITYLPTDLEYLVVGDIPLDGIQSNMLLKGTYKVFYHFVINRQINTIRFSARGGPSIPIYYLISKSGDLILTRGSIYKPYQEYDILIRDIFLNEFITQPIGACYYPVYYRILE